MPEFSIPKRRRIFLMRHGDVTYFDDSGRAIDPDTVAPGRVLPALARLRADTSWDTVLLRDVRHTTMEMLYSHYLRYRHD